jgi:hypothetical protein
MDLDNMDLVKSGKLTSFYFKLLENVNTKIDSKIKDVSSKIIAEFETKKREILKLKTQLDEFNKIKQTIDNLNEFYNFIKVDNKVESKRTIKSMPLLLNPNPVITTKNLLDTLENVEVRIENGEFIQVSAKNSSAADLSLLIKETDSLLSTQNRLIVKKKHNIQNIDRINSSFDTSQLNIIIKFNDHRINPDDIFIRYLTAPTENKSIFSYINAVLGSNDGKNWELISNVNYSLMRNFDKASLFKYPACMKPNMVNKNNFYQYICFQSFPSKDIIPTNQINRYISRTNIPLCNFEIFGSYYNVKNEIILSNIEGQFQEFFELYINTNYEEASKKVDFEYVINMFLESYKELNSLITDFKIDHVMKSVANDYKKKADAERVLPELKLDETEINLDTNEVELLEETLEKSETDTALQAAPEETVEKEEKTDTETPLDAEPEEQKAELTEDISNQTIDNEFLENLMNNIPVIQSDNRLSARKKKLIKTMAKRKNNKPIKVIDTGASDNETDGKYNRKKK